MTEVWRLVPSLPGILASSYGRVMVVPHNGAMPHGGTRPYGGFPTYGQWTGTRYIYVHKGKTYKVHRLVCEAFHGEPVLNSVNICMHLDEDARNNRPENLKWGTQKENLNFSGFLKYCRSRTGEDNPYLKGKKKKESEAA